MGLTNYRLIFDRLRNYEFETRPRLRDVGLIAKEYENEVYGKVLNSVSATIWDGEKQLDPRPVEEFKKALLSQPDQKIFYITRDGKIISTFNTSPYDHSILTEENVKDVSERVLDEITTGAFNEEMLTVVINELVEMEIKNPTKKKAPVSQSPAVR
jgi:hypothetical protein